MKYLYPFLFLCLYCEQTTAPAAPETKPAPATGTCKVEVTCTWKATSISDYTTQTHSDYYFYNVTEAQCRECQTNQERAVDNATPASCFSYRTWTKNR